MPQFEVRFFPSEIFWTVVSFVLLFALLKWLVMPRLTMILERRTRAIEAELEKAKQQREEAEKLRGDYQRQLDDAADDARRMFDESEARVREQHRKMMDEWKSDMKRREEAFREETELARQRALREIRAEAAEMVVGATEKLLHGHMDDAEAKQALNDAIADLDKKNPKSRKH
jgi:F-type H+-transporting ATPase subunit b